MVSFPNAKINIGLNILNKRDDGFHNLETIFYPINLCDVLEFVEVDGRVDFSNSGLNIDCDIEDNLCVKAYRLLQKNYNLPNIKIHLHKVIPFGAGLGGGSSDASFVLKSLNEYFQLGISSDTLKEFSSQLGSDCAFFIDNKPSFAYDRGEKLQEIDLNLKGYHIVLVKPDIHISTQEAYAGINPKVPEVSLKELISQPIENWKNSIFNDFENHLFKAYPLIKKIKEDLYNMGAVYASMSGSGSSVYGIFKEKVDAKIFKDYFVWQGML